MRQCPGAGAIRAGPRATMWPAVASVLFPDPPRRIPFHRGLGIALRTGHLVAFGALLGGHIFDVDPSRLVPFLAATIATGAGLMALEMASTCAWLFMGKGMAVVAKLALLAAIPAFWEHRVAILVAAVVVASVGAHMPSRLRHYSFLLGRVVEPPERTPADPAGAAARERRSRVGETEGGYEDEPAPARLPQPLQGVSNPHSGAPGPGLAPERGDRLPEKPPAL